MGWTVRILVLFSKLSYGIIEFYRLTQKMVVMLMQEDGINFYYHVRRAVTDACLENSKQVFDLLVLLVNGTL